MEEDNFPIHKQYSIKGGGGGWGGGGRGVLMNIFSKSIYQLLFVLSNNIVPSSSNRWSRVSTIYV